MTTQDHGNTHVDELPDLHLDFVHPNKVHRSAIAVVAFLISVILFFRRIYAPRTERGWGPFAPRRALVIGLSHKPDVCVGEPETKPMLRRQRSQGEDLLLIEAPQHTALQAVARVCLVEQVDQLPGHRRAVRLLPRQQDAPQVLQTGLVVGEVGTRRVGGVEDVVRERKGVAGGDRRERGLDFRVPCDGGGVPAAGGEVVRLGEQSVREVEGAAGEGGGQKDGDGSEESVGGICTVKSFPLAAFGLVLVYSRARRKQTVRNP